MIYTCSVQSADMLNNKKENSPVRDLAIIVPV